MRKRDGLTLVQMAERAQVSISTLSRVERAAMNVHVPTLYRIAVAAGDAKLAEALRPYVAPEA
jgi:transcriptional regulator with XRE-family HTH domain